jgi:hypothetical protein
MNDFFITPKSAGSTANEAGSGVSERMSKNAGSDSATQTGKGNFGAALMALAKAKTPSRGNKPPLQHGNTLTKKAPMGGVAQFASALTGGPGLGAQSTEGQTALNPKQRGPSNKHAQSGGGHGAAEDTSGRH